MSKWRWSFGSVPQLSKWRWAVIAGDQEAHSPDDQQCGDHFIEKDLECHEGDAHRPTPGKNPYFQGGRKGPEDKSKDTSERDRGEVTPKTKERKESQEREGTGPVTFADERFDHYTDQLEQAWEEKTGKPLVWNDKRLHEMLEMVMRDTAREYSLDSEELGFQELGIGYYGPEDSPREPQRGGPKKGYKGRALWRPRTHEKPTTTPRDGAGTEKVPPGFRSELGKGLLQKIRDLKGGERGVESDLNWSGSKIMMDQAEQPAHPGCPSESDLMALDQALPSLPGDQPKKKRGMFGMLEETLNWRLGKPALAAELNWTGARPCTEGDDDSEYGPHGDDQKCVDEGGSGIVDEGYDEPASDVPEGFQEVDTGDPDLEPEGGDWEETLGPDEEDDMDVKKTMKEEEREGKKESKEQQQFEKESGRTATRLDRDPNLGPDEYHQFWNQDSLHINKARELLEQRAANPKSPEDAEAVRSLLMNGPKVGGGYEKAGKVQPGEPSAEDILEPERSRGPII